MFTIQIRKNIGTMLVGIFIVLTVKAEDGHSLWLRRETPKPVKVVCSNKSAILDQAVKALRAGWQGESGAMIRLRVEKDKAIKDDGFKLSPSEIQANTAAGILYGVYELLRRQQTGQVPENAVVNPSYQRRILNHWDNLDGSVERGYAGASIFWRGEEALSVTAEDRKRWEEYAEANASIGINGSVLNNVNASPKILSRNVLEKVKVIADVLRPYGIKTYLSVNFASPTILGGLKTSDPINTEVINWWKAKVKEIYALVPDFGGFLVKANSEGQSGPQDFGRTHVDGANMMADVLNPYGGIVMWRAFVYSPTDNDRAKQAYDEFMPFDGKFRDNVIVQVKNGPIDFQPREPFSPLFGAMKKTAIMPELQITQEYLGHAYQLVFLSTMWEECLKSDTYQEGPGSTVAKCTDGRIFDQKHTAIAGVANTGLDTNWCGHQFAQANWYAFGRLAWNDELSSEQIADEWLKLTFKNAEGTNSQTDWDSDFLQPVKQMMMESHDAAVDYSMPLGLHHIFAPHAHYGPGPWWAPEKMRADWTPPYYHQADTIGIGFDRTQNGSDAVGQYHEPLASQFNDVDKCPEIYLLWFHHLPWDYQTKSGRILWDELCYRYDKGVRQVRAFQKVWDKVQHDVDEQRFKEVQSKLRRQARDAQVWKDACLLYFQQFSRRPIPSELERPVYDLEFLQSADPLSLYK
ncbi:alpha-glucuronidase [Olivibacter sp. XZL3]|uniref:alpha-glucuronidase n=1 Tax=Olivibacter sp. XZL3 TaxID=1735116 RepID=UPI00197EBFDE|nr:alpha-glucuronidase [Olivibacter sp. XZL3]